MLARLAATTALALAVSLPAFAAPQQFTDRPAHFQPPAELLDYTRRDAMIRMRDGARLHTVILAPKGLLAPAPMMLTRTPYSADARVGKVQSPHLAAITPTGDETFIAAGYIRVYQDVRGKYKSEGDYVMNRPFVGPLNPTKVDHSTDTYDTIEWLIHNVPNNNGRVGMIGTSYDGFTVLAGLVNPHPALKAAVPIAPMVDGWMGDDWFHHGATRVYGTDYVYDQEATRSNDETYPFSKYDQYDEFLDVGAVGNMGRKMGMEQLGFWNKLRSHPNYDAFWQGQAMDRILAARPITVPTLLVDGLFDQEDIYGAPAVFAALHPLDKAGIVHIAFGPWSHGQSNTDGSHLGKIMFSEDTGRRFRREVLQPFLDAHLRTDVKDPTPPVLAYETGSDGWHTYKSWPVSCASGCLHHSQAIYLTAAGGLEFGKPATAGYAQYVSDPARPVTYVPRPIRPEYQDHDAWRQWLVSDQRNAAARPDVLVFETAPLTQPIHIAGTPIANLIASTTGTDSDFVVKLIDVYPDEYPRQTELGGYQLMVSADIIRGRFRNDPSRPEAFVAGQPTPVRLPLPNANHVFLPGHRVMVQVQSSWFPLYDRNPQTFVPNIFDARPGDYVAATQRIYTGGATASSIELPVAPQD